MGNKVQANQNGAQDRGNSAQGNKNKLNQGNNAEIGGNIGGNVTVTNGIPAETLTTLVGQLTAPSKNEVQSATPPALTPAASTETDASEQRKKFIRYGVIAAVVVVVVIIVRKIFTKS